MAADLGNAYVNIIPKAPGISNNIESIFNGGEASAGIKKAGSGLGAKLMTGLKVGAAAAGVALAKIVKDSFEAGGKLEQSFGGLDTIFGDAAGAAKMFAMHATEMGISANTYAEQAVGMGAALTKAFKGDSLAAVKAADMAISDMSDNAAKMGTPIESLQNAYQGFAKGNYTMLDNLKLGYGGTQEEMKRLLADAEKFSGVKYDINNLGDVYAAIHVIQGELGLTGVAAAEASTTLSGSAAAMKASWENVMAALTTGTGLETAMANLGTSVSNFASNVLRMAGNLGKQFPGMIKGLAKTAMDNAPQFIASGVELMVKLAIGVVNGIPKVVTKLPQFFAKVKEAFAGYNWGALGMQLMQGIVAGINTMRTAIWEAIKSALSGLGSKIWAWIKEQVRGGAGGGGGPSGGGASPAANGGLRKNGLPASNAIPGTGSPRNYVPYAPRTDAARQELADLLRSGIQVDTHVYLEGDAGKFLKVVNKANYANTVRTGSNLLAARG